MNRTAQVGIGVVVLLLVVGGGAAVAVGTGALQRPTVESVESNWGAITSEESEIVTTVIVNNPNPISLQAGNLGIEYTVMMNDVEMASGAKRGIDLKPGTNRVELVTGLDNTKIPDWWVTHINNGERTEVTIDPEVRADLLFTSFSMDAPTQSQSIETDLLGKLNTDESRPVMAFGQTLMTVEQTRGRWGTATTEKTPLEVEATIKNPNPIPIVLTEITYTVQMNEVTVANGSTADPVRLPAGSTKAVETTAILETQKLGQWWASHLRNDEVTQLEVRFSAVVEIQGRQVEVPLTETSETIETNILGS